MQINIQLIKKIRMGKNEIGILILFSSYLVQYYILLLNLQLVV